MQAISLRHIQTMHQELLTGGSPADAHGDARVMTEIFPFSRSHGSLPGPAAYTISRRDAPESC